MGEWLVTKVEATKHKIIRALLCAAGEHEPWERKNQWNGGIETVHLSIQSDMHGEVYCCVCKHCRTIYVRKRVE